MRFLVALTTLLVASAAGQNPAHLALQPGRWDAARIAPRRAMEAGRIVDRIMAHEVRYRGVDERTRVPWYVIAALHNMESGGSFRHHLHEGSPLTGRTRWVPKGRPLAGAPPFTWEFSAIDALLYDRMSHSPPHVDWSRLDKTLYQTERYNGLGYLLYRQPVPSPYLWAGTSIERPGRYIADGKWSPTARSNQIGTAAVWKTMEQRGILDFRRLRR
jgi:lysozyme family protein